MLQVEKTPDPFVFAADLPRGSSKSMTLMRRNCFSLARTFFSWAGTAAKVHASRAIKEAIADLDMAGAPTGS